MRFTAATVALFAGLAAAIPNPDTTVYETEEVTITSCGPEVTNCPASSHASTTAPVAWTTSAPGGGAGAGTSPAPSPSSSSAPAPSGVPSWTTSQPAPVPTSASSVPAPPPAGQSSYTVISHTTCVPTVVYSTVPVPSGTSPVTSGAPGPHSPSPAASSSVPVGPSGGASATPSPSATPFNAAGTVSGSMGFAGLAAAAAYFLA